MKKWIRRITALVIAAMLLAGAAVAEKETFSEGFRLPNIQVRPTAPAEEPAQSEEVEAEKTVLGNAVVTLSDAGSSLNIRAQASKDSEKVGVLSNGEEVFILGTSGEWTNIRTAIRMAWLETRRPYGRKLFLWRTSMTPWLARDAIKTLILLRKLCK